MSIDAMPCNAANPPYSTQTQNKWTDEQRAMLVELHAEGLSTSVMCGRINEKFGTGFTRNAIIGCIHRLGLPKRRPGARTDIPRRNQTERGGGTIQRIRHRANGGARELPQDQPITPPKFLGLTLMQRENNQCHYPMGDGPYFFCGNPVKEGSNYCEFCHALTHIDQLTRRAAA